MNRFLKWSFIVLSIFITGPIFSDIVSTPNQIKFKRFTNQQYHICAIDYQDRPFCVDASGASRTIRNSFEVSQWMPLVLKNQPVLDINLGYQGGCALLKSTQTVICWQEHKLHYTDKNTVVDYTKPFGEKKVIRMIGDGPVGSDPLVALFEDSTLDCTYDYPGSPCAGIKSLQRSDKAISDIFAVSRGICAVYSDKTVACHQGDFPNYFPKPDLVPNINDVQTIVGSLYGYKCALNSLGKATCWYMNDGTDNPDFLLKFPSEKLRRDYGTKVISDITEYNANMCVISDSILDCFGVINYVGTPSISTVSNNARSVRLSPGVACVITNNDDLYCWSYGSGYNGSGFAGVDF